jgi:hypothetical protein
MKKIKHRKGMVALMLAAAVLFYFGGHFAWDGITHHGSGVWQFGGDEPGTDGQIGTDEFSEVIPETQYKRECYAAAVMFFVFGGGILWEVIKKWKERNELEKSWERTVSNPESLQEVHKHPELYRDDFKKWINENHPNLKIWTLPPHSSN